jgi:hypothetical protein
MVTQTGFAFNAEHNCIDCTIGFVKNYTKKDYIFTSTVPEDYDWSAGERRTTLLQLIEDGVLRDGEGNRIHPLFDTDETDYPAHCSNCGTYLDTSWTQEGQNMVLEHFGVYIENYIYPELCEHSGNPDVLDEWAEHADDSTAKSVYLFIRGEEST